MLRIRRNDLEAAPILTDVRTWLIYVRASLSVSHHWAILISHRNYTEAESLPLHARDLYFNIGNVDLTVYYFELPEQCVRASDDVEIMETSS